LTKSSNIAGGGGCIPSITTGGTAPADHPAVTFIGAEKFSKICIPLKSNQIKSLLLPNRKK